MRPPMPGSFGHPHQQHFAPAPPQGGFYVHNGSMMPMYHQQANSIHYGHGHEHGLPQPPSSVLPSSPPLVELPLKPVKILVNHNRLIPGEDSDHEQSNDQQSSLPQPKSTEHELEDVWTFWYLRFEKNFSWDHSQIEIGDCHTAEYFWGIFDKLLPLTEAHHGCNYSLFKKGIRPIWEDPMNRHGGRFVFTITKEKRAYKEMADRMWLEFAMAVVGNILPDVSDQICGIIGGNRNNAIKIAVWTRDCQKVEEAKKIGKFA